MQSWSESCCATEMRIHAVLFAEDPGEKNGESRAKDRQQDVKGRIRCRWCHWPGGHVQDGFEKLVHKNEEPSFKIEASVKCDIVF